MPPRWTQVVLLLLALGGEARTWRGYRARAARSPQDAGSFQVNHVLGGIAILCGLAYGLRGRPAVADAIPRWLAWAGIPVSLGGTALRAWAVSTLGRTFTLTVQVRPGQRLVDRGPYRLVRHPSYVGGELAVLGAGLSAGSWGAAAIYLVPWLVAHLYRIRVEERAMLETLGDAYRAYRARTWRLVPFVW